MYQCFLLSVGWDWLRTYLAKNIVDPTFSVGETEKLCSVQHRRSWVIMSSILTIKVSQHVYRLVPSCINYAGREVFGLSLLRLYRILSESRAFGDNDMAKCSVVILFFWGIQFKTNTFFFNRQLTNNVSWTARQTTITRDVSWPAETMDPTNKLCNYKITLWFF